MSFDYQLEKGKDLWSVVHRIIPSISLIRKKAKTEDDLQKAMKMKEKYSRKKAIYEELKSLPNNLKDSKQVNKLLDNATKEYEECILTIDELQKVLSQLNTEIDEYIKYMDSFTEFNYEDYIYLRKGRPSGNREIWHAIILLAVNHGICNQEREKIRNSLCKEFCDGDIPLFINSNNDMREEFINKWLCAWSYGF